jgi:hypothetical protein
MGFDFDGFDFDGKFWQLVSFAVWKPMSVEFRFIRMTQTGQNHVGNDELCIRAFDVFGTLLEEREQTSKSSFTVIDSIKSQLPSISHPFQLLHAYRQKDMMRYVRSS